MSAARFYVAGKVQGVWFRASAREQAMALGLRGYARNLRDGRVEVLAVGDAAAIERLAQWLSHGPPMARVDRLLREDASEEEASEAFVCG
ncbi:MULTISPECIES: acylphosphatase [unclassified Lysobacter]|uniref:acylphosphatase n=1 Tax=unclassified Lysobacter TaxID=2635362 RepID=UPI001BE69045|nr:MULTISPECIES: acylphosphatase [unclassified Lysobacter]MBT2747796.1 acylphosphatase [Lysobacter sp. ISL-42]MBT2751482.1 acylphosphatase [Lysobacter sp. ISL-50]MBT2778209.1 acylphosphatase [Lysobacter sp. ISL-54]MBT2782744.1 acylphosphatase [Lysobacter sp. ISL-52]